MIEEASHEGAVGLDVVHAGLNGRGDVFSLLERVGAEVSLEAGPDVLIGVEVGRVAGQEVNANAAAVHLEESAHRRGAVGWMAIDDEFDGLGQVLEHGFQELQEARRVQIALEAAKPHLAARTDRGDHVDLPTRSAHQDERRPAALAPSTADARFFVNTRFIQEEQCCLAALRRANDGGELRLHPMHALHVVALERASSGLLRREPDAVQHARDRRCVEHHAEQAIDELRDDGQGPQRGTKVQLPRILAQDDSAQALDLIGLQLGLTPRSLRALDARRTCAAEQRHPLPHGVHVNVQASRHRTLRFTSEHALHRLTSHLFQGGVIQASCVALRHEGEHDSVYPHYVPKLRTYQ